MSYIKTSDILIRDKNKSYLQINYKLDGVVSINKVELLINDVVYKSSYHNFNYAVFDLSFLEDEHEYQCYINIEFIAEENFIIDNYDDLLLLTDDNYSIAINKMPYTSSEEKTFIADNYDNLLLTDNGYLIDRVLLNAKARRTVYIITSKPEEMKELIYNTANRGATFVNVTGAYTKESYTMLICTMDKNEAYKVTPLIETIDNKAFSFVTSCKEVKGEYN